MHGLRGALAFALALVLALAPALVFGAGCSHRKAETEAEVFTRAVTAYLERKGTLCLGKSVWPIDVTQRDILQKARNAVQLPVLERLGLVTSTVLDVDTPGDEETPARRQEVRRYQLTDAGDRYYLDAGAAGGRDLCAARLDLDRVVSWDLAGDAQPPRATVKYTYRVTPFPWTADPQARDVFPAVARVIDGAGRAQLEETFTRTGDGWVAVDLQGSPQ